MTQARWRNLTEWPLAIAAMVFLVAYSYEVIAEPGGKTAEVIIAATSWIVERVEQKETEAEATTVAHLEALTTEVASLRKLIEENVTTPVQNRPASK
jgi:voltage-gated potassium channel